MVSYPTPTAIAMSFNDGLRRPKILLVNSPIYTDSVAGMNRAPYTVGAGVAKSKAPGLHANEVSRRLTSTARRPHLNSRPCGGLRARARRFCHEHGRPEHEGVHAAAGPHLHRTAGGGELGIADRRGPRQHARCPRRRVGHHRAGRVGSTRWPDRAGPVPTDGHTALPLGHGRTRGVLEDPRSDPEHRRGTWRPALPL